MLETLALPFLFPFMQDAFLIALIIAPPTALLSCYLVLKGWSLMGDAVSHAVMPGIVLAYLFGIPLLIGAFVAGMTCAVATGYVKAHSRIKEDTVMGVVFSGMFGLGLVLYAKAGAGIDLHHILYGNMLGVGAEDLWTAGLVSLVVTGAVVAKRRDLLLHAFDPGHARAVGLPVGVLHYGLLALLSLTIVATLSAVGIILAIGLLIAPGAIAFLITKRFERMLAIAVAITSAAMVTGVYVSFFIDSAPAPTVILILSAVFVMVFALRTRRKRTATTPELAKTAQSAAS